MNFSAWSLAFSASMLPSSQRHMAPNRVEGIILGFQIEKEQREKDSHES